MANVYQIVTDRIVEQIEDAIKNGTNLPWQKPWSALEAPRNYVSQKTYRGVNLFLLDMGHTYLSWSQICDLQKHNREIKLKKGSKSKIVVFFSFKTHQKDVVNENGHIEQKEVSIPFLRYYNVYDSNDVENLPPLTTEQKTYSHITLRDAETVLENYIEREDSLNLIYNDGEGAWYSPCTDTISLPRKELFSSYEKFFATAMHECAHSTGAKKRLNRLKGSRFGDEAYSLEELTADMTQNFIFAELGINSSEVYDNSIAYMKGWLSALKNNVQMIVSASSRAEKATNYILNGKSEEI